MTLIAAVGLESHSRRFRRSAYISSERPAPVPNIPLVGEVENVFPTGSAESILGLNQKVVLLGDNCVIAWAGNVEFARRGNHRLAGSCFECAAVAAHHRDLPVTDRPDSTRRSHLYRMVEGWRGFSSILVPSRHCQKRDVWGGKGRRQRRDGFRHARCGNFRGHVERSGSRAAGSRAGCIFECYRLLRFCFRPSCRAKALSRTTSAGAAKSRHLSATNLQGWAI